MIESYRWFIEEEGSPQAFFQEVARLQIAPIRPCGLPILYTMPKSKLLPLTELVAPIRLQGQGGGMVSVHQFELVWSQTPVLDQAKYINLELRKLLNMPIPTLEQVMDHLVYLCELPPPSILEAERYSRLTFPDCIREIYAFLSNALQEHGEEIKDRLYGMPCILLDRYATQSHSTDWQFVTGAQVFFNLLIGKLSIVSICVSNILFFLR